MGYSTIISEGRSAMESSEHSQNSTADLELDHYYYLGLSCLLTKFYLAKHQEMAV